MVNGLVFLRVALGHLPLYGLNNSSWFPPTIHVFRLRCTPVRTCSRRGGRGPIHPPLSSCPHLRSPCQANAVQLVTRLSVPFFSALRSRSVFRRCLSRLISLGLVSRIFLTIRPTHRSGLWAELSGGA